jgi:predicted DNA-binding transcriptional regulator YafY
MGRGDRLFRIVQMLRRDRITTGAALARELGVSLRTLYRDMADLAATGVAIEGEAGTGYRLPRHFDLPQLTFTVDELEALLAGARVMAAWGDPDLQAAARDALVKVEAAVPEALRRRLAHSEIHAPEFFVPPVVARGMGDLRLAMRECRKVRIRYRRGDGETSARTIHPLGLFFWGTTWALAAWCELREGFRTFRVDRIADLEVLPGTFPILEGRALRDYVGLMEASPRPGPSPDGTADVP